jgi:glycosyltransferase involved in cell wall biosynthesis
MVRFCLIGPTYPFRGGIAHHTTLLARHLRQDHETLLLSFTRQYPRWLFPGRSDRDPSRQPLRTEAEYLLDPLNPLSWLRTARRAAQWQPEVIVMPWWVPFWAPAWAFLGRRLKRLPGRPPLLFICHNVLPHEGSLLDRFALRLALTPGDGFIVHASEDARKLARILPQARMRIARLPTLAALGETGAAALPVAVPDDRPLLLFCGFVRPYKGLDILLEALPQVLAERPAHLLVAGEFWGGSAAYQEQITQLGLQSAVTLLDRYLANEELVACIDAAAVVVLPYRSATQSAVIQIAFGRSKPVITTDVGGLAEAVQDGQTGLVVAPEDPTALAAAVNRFFEQGLAEPFKANIRQADDRFAWSHLEKALLSLAGLDADTKN